MNRPYIVCHMMTALDGKITGPFMESPVADGESDTVTLFEKRNAAGDPVTFTLKDVEKGRDNSIWLCYSVNN